jgi:hypothetical protein
VAVAVILLAAGTGLLWATRSRMVVTTWPPFGSFVTHAPSATLRNPFRDPGPERAAETFLDRLKRDPGLLYSLFMPAEDRQGLVEREGRLPLVSWTMVQGHRAGGEAKLEFVMKRRLPARPEGDPGFEWVPATLTIQLTPAGWRVKEYHAAY